MSNDVVTVVIDGVVCEAKEGEYILNVARRNNIFIPAICYVPNCSATLACRLCIVEADGKRVYSCNAKVKDGMNISTTSEDILKERRAIMEVYDLNHPLACGVCDQSGECELQNYTLEMEVDSQRFSIKDTNRPTKEWNFIHYDSSLCIVCEKCVTICKDMIGEAALKTIKRGGETVDKSWKEKAPKDAYAMWNKLQKFVIGTASGDEELNCTMCGECVAVCPVGALVSKDFQYKSNAWELKKIPAANPHSSDCSLIYYNVKHNSIEDTNQKIYRVTNDYHFSPIHGGIRYGYDFENRVEKRDKEAFDKVIESLKTRVDTIVFDSFITNEEALILQKLKEEYGYKLINPDAKAYKDFIENFSKTSGESLYNGDLSEIQKSNFIISVGSFIKNDNPNCGYAFNNALTMNKGAGVYFHPIKDLVVEKYSKNIITITNKVGSEEAILYLILDLFGENLPQKLDNYLKTFHSKIKKSVVEDVEQSIKEIVKKVIVDEQSGEEKEVEEEIEKVVIKKVEKEIEVDRNALLEIVGIDEAFNQKLEKLLLKKDKFSLIVGEDLYRHPRSTNLAKLLGLIQKHTKFSVVIVPSKTNTLGVSLICDLDEKEGKFSLGYNSKGNITIGAIGGEDLAMPALNQQEGTFTSINKRVVPTNVALEFGGYCLNDIANELGLKAEHTIDYTKKLPIEAGFKSVEFDLLPNEFKPSGEENRGYILQVSKNISSDDVEELDTVLVLDEDIVYLANPVHQFSPFTNKAHQLNQAGALYVSSEWLKKRGLKNGDLVKIQKGEDSLTIKVELDCMILGDIAYLPTFDTKLNTESIFLDGYRYSSVSIKGV